MKVLHPVVALKRLDKQAPSRKGVVMASLGDSVFKAVHPALLELYGRGVWQAKPNSSTRGDTIVAPNGTQLAKLPTNQTTAYLLNLLNGKKEGRWIPKEVVDWAAHALLEGLGNTIPGRWVVTNSGGILTFTTPEGQLAAQGLPQHLEAQFREIMYEYVGQHPGFQFIYG